jgi:predicted nucleic acid-binding protein
MAECWVTNASPLIVLTKVGLERPLTELPDELLVPAAVAREVRGASEAARSGPDQPGADLCIVDAPPPPQEIAAWDLGPGETAVLSLALADPSRRAILDDAAARRCARAIGVPVLGTLGVLVRAKHAGVLHRIAPTIERLREVGLYVSDEVAAAARALAGE